MSRISQAEYTDRFVAFMTKHGGPVFADGSSIATYARNQAPNYYQPDHDTTPEEDAEADMDCWEAEA